MNAAVGTACALTRSHTPCVAAQTQFEAWLSFQSVTSEGLVSRRSHARRNHVVTVHGAPAALAGALADEWSQCTPDEAHAKLSKPDVAVTNQRDKDEQLPKLLLFNDTVKGAFSPQELALLDSVRTRAPARRASSWWPLRAAIVPSRGSPREAQPPPHDLAVVAGPSVPFHPL